MDFRFCSFAFHSLVDVVMDKSVMRVACFVIEAPAGAY